MNRIALITLFPAMLLAAGSALSADDAEIAKKAKDVCAACHGPDGSTPTGPDFPKLGGQHSDYLLQTLKAYKTGARRNPIMAAQVQTLSMQEMEGLAAYYARQPGTLVTKR